MNIGIIGSGSWGLALSIVFSEKNNVKLWIRREETLNYLKEHRESPDYLKGIKLPKNIIFTSYFEELKDRDVIFVVVPSKYFRETIRNFKKYIEEKVIISCTKGIETDTLYFPTDIIKEEINPKYLGVLSGPSHAEEVARKLPCAVTLSTNSTKITKQIQKEISTNFFRVYEWHDTRGIEISGAYKNVIAISAGIIDGLNLGNNAKASLITRGLHEIVKLGKKIGGKTETFYGLSGVGDLIVTCTSNYSRNRNLGEMIARGYKAEEVMKNSKMVAEGYYNAISVKKLSEKYRVELPIANEVYEIIYNSKNPIESLKDLMKRELKQEFYF
ncbi:MAG: NAD(P)H-dependent glycerol-3-phosphate dehydrogenase [Brevinematia bacterium]